MCADGNPCSNGCERTTNNDIHALRVTDRQSDRQTDKQSDRQTDRQSDSQTDMDTNEPLT